LWSKYESTKSSTWIKRRNNKTPPLGRRFVLRRKITTLAFTPQIIGYILSTMSFISEYSTYLKNNPQGYWFKRKLYGFGWVPATKQGWGVLALFGLFVVGISLWAETNVSDDQATSHVIVPLLLATALFLLVTYRTGEPLKWQWGKRDGK
jgi:hypothetical protein